MVHNNVKQAREALGVNQTELGKLCGVSRQTISSIERGEYQPSIGVVLKMASVLNQSIEQLFWLEEE